VLGLGPYNVVFWLGGPRSADVTLWVDLARPTG
jgi:hypothetical protein